MANRFLTRWLISAASISRASSAVRRQMICDSVLVSGKEVLARGWRLCGVGVMLQAAIGDGLAFDPFAFEEDGLAASEVDVGRGEIAEALMMAAMIVVLDEGRDLALEGAGQVVVLEQDAVLQGLVPALDLALCLRMVGRTADVLHAFAVQPFSEIDGDVGRTIVRQQSRPVNDGDVVEAGSRQGEIEGGRHVLGPHGRTEFPGLA